MSCAVRLSHQYAAAWVRYPDGTEHAWLLQLDQPSFHDSRVGAAFDVPDQPPLQDKRRPA